MNPRHKYEYKVNPNSAGDRVVRMVGADKRVLEIGAGPGTITRLLKAHNNCRITAIEIDESAIEKLSPYCEQVHQLDLNDTSWTSDISKEGKFKVIVAADVLEHLYDPWSTLRAMSGLLDENGYVVVSLPHIGHNAIIACLTEEDFSYQDWGLLDRTHIRFFGIRNIQQLFDEAGFNIVEAEFVVKHPDQTEFAANWRRASHALKQSLSRSRFGMVYQVVIKAKPNTTPEKGLDLSSLPVPKPSQALPSGTPISRRTVYMAKMLLLRHLGLKNFTKLDQLLNRMKAKR